MAISASDIKFKLSIKSGSAGNTLPQTDPNSSLGKYISTTEITDATLNNLFDDITGDRNASSAVDYRCFFVHNAHATLAWLDVYVWISAEAVGGADCEIGLDTTMGSPIGSAAIQALEVADSSTPPTGVVFSAPTSKATGLPIGNLVAGYCKAVWVKRSAKNTPAKDNDSVTISFGGDTNE